MAQMKSPLAPLLLAAVVTALIGMAVWMEPYFAGDVAVTRSFQSAVPDPGWWARPVSSLAPAPAKYYVMVVTAVLAYVLAGWRGLVLIAAFIAIEQYGAESTKAIFQRPRPSRELIATASGSGYSFPSTTVTFFCATFGVVLVLAALRRQAPGRWPLLGAASIMLALVCAARVALGAHWPSDVVLTTVICLSWIWAASRLVLGRA
jgi:membrane-associated phospholipid phosphatase